MILPKVNGQAVIFVVFTFSAEIRSGKITFTILTPEPY